MVCYAVIRDTDSDIVILSVGRNAGVEIDALLARGQNELNGYTRRAEIGDPLVIRMSVDPRSSELVARGNAPSRQKAPPKPPHIIETDPDGRQRIIHYHIPPHMQSRWRRADNGDLLFGRMVEGFELDELD